MCFCTFFSMLLWNEWETLMGLPIKNCLIMMWEGWRAGGEGKWEEDKGAKLKFHAPLLLKQAQLAHWQQHKGPLVATFQLQTWLKVSKESERGLLFLKLFYPERQFWWEQQHIFVPFLCLIPDSIKTTGRQEWLRTLHYNHCVTGTATQCLLSITV